MYETGVTAGGDFVHLSPSTRARVDPIRSKVHNHPNPQPPEQYGSAYPIVEPYRSDEMPYRRAGQSVTKVGRCVVLLVISGRRLFEGGANGQRGVWTGFRVVLAVGARWIFLGARVGHAARAHASGLVLQCRDGLVCPVSFARKAAANVATSYVHDLHPPTIAALIGLRAGLTHSRVHGDM